MIGLEELMLKFLITDYGFAVADLYTQEEWDLALDEAQTELSVCDAESGADREGCYDPERSWEDALEQAHKDTNNIYTY